MFEMEYVARSRFLLELNLWQLCAISNQRRSDINKRVTHGNLHIVLGDLRDTFSFDH